MSKRPGLGDRSQPPKVKEDHLRYKRTPKAPIYKGKLPGLVVKPRTTPARRS